MTYALKSANLFYGRQRIPVERCEGLPLPDFDPLRPEDTAFQTMAIMSNASGGFTLRGAVLKVYADHAFASLVGPGYSVFWGEREAFRKREGETAEQLVARHDAMYQRALIMELPYGVATDQYHEGWKRARKVANQEQSIS